MGKIKPSRAVLRPSMDWAIDQLPGLSTTDQAHLMECGIWTTGQLFQQTRTLPQRQAVASKLQTPIQYINKWAALADLARIPAVGCQYCGLLLHAGVASVAQLAQTPLPRLHQQMLKLQVAMMQRRDLCPSLEEVSEWIKQAKAIATLSR
jgi:predicted flap endonuclease-1-like 5' DNA nuclease